MTTAQEKFDCETCREIWRMFTDPEFEDPIVFGSFEDVASMSCRNHAPLVQALANLLDGAISYDGDPTFKIVRSDSNRCVLELVAAYQHIKVPWQLLLIAKDTVEPHPGIGRILNAEWADLDIITDWKDACLTTHGAACDSVVKIKDARPDVLIDVVSNCLVRGCDVQGRYVALSYVWGGHQPKLSGAIERAELFKTDALNRQDVKKGIFPIIYHSMKLTDQLRERYLWVDALCIDHHDKERTLRQLQAMAGIYANAFVTIINVDGDAGTGIFGLKGVSGAREQHQRLFQFGDEHICVRNTREFDLSGNKRQEYFTRGWTYQENTLASRRLIVLGNEVHWQCQRAAWHEELVFNTQIDANLDLELSYIMGIPSLGKFSNMIVEYNSRALTYDEDSLPAISGLLTLMSRSFTGGFLFGLPEMFFSQSLAWQPILSSNLKRRSPSQRPMEAKLLPCDLPSWSWIGWRGSPRIEMDAWQIRRETYRAQEIFPITEWSCGKSPTDPPSMRRLISDDWYTQRERWKDPVNPIPPDWIRHEISAVPELKDEILLYPEGCGRYVFENTALSDPGKKITYWHYPCPFPVVDESTPSVVPEQWPYLFCTTESVRVKACRGREEKNEVLLYDGSGSRGGRLLVHNHDSFAEFPSDPPGREVELVALHRVDLFRKTFNEDTNRYEAPVKKRIGAMCVLWVEWEDGVAFRRGCGDVDPGVWPTLNPKEIDLVLG